MLPGILGTKLGQFQTFTQEGQRIPVTLIQAGPCSVIAVKILERDHYLAVQLGLGLKKPKNTTRALQGHFKKAGIGEQNLPRFLREIRLSPLTEFDDIKPGSQIKVGDVLNIGDMVRITGISKGKGFAGVVKRYHFKGGPRTHGQSDRERAPGAIGQTTTPGRVYKGKRMGGRMGNKRVTVKNLIVVGVDAEKNILTIKGLVPGPVGSILSITRQN